MKLVEEILKKRRKSKSHGFWLILRLTLRLLCLIICKYSKSGQERTKEKERIVLLLHNQPKFSFDH